MDNFFNTLFGIEVTIFGIISAVILVFIQLIYSNYSYKHISHILRNKYLVLFIIFSTVDLILTSVASFILSFYNFPYTQTPIQKVINIITDPFYGFLCLILIFISISFFIILIVKNITYLQPHRAIFLLSEGIQYEDIRDIIWKKYGLKPPFNIRIRINYSDIALEGDSKKTEKAINNTHNQKEHEQERKLEEITKQIEKIKKRTDNSEDPLLPIRDLMIQFIRRADLSSLSEANELLSSIITKFIVKIPSSIKEVWSPNDILSTNFTRYLVDLLSTLLEISDKEGLESAQKIVLSAGYLYSIKLFEIEHYDDLDIMQRFYLKVADKSLGKATSIFQDIIENYQTIGDKVFDLLKEKPTSEKVDNRLFILDNLFRCLGWLGERLLTKLPFEDTPIMPNYDFNTEYSAFYNCLLGFSDRYDREQPGLYPLIYFDSLYVVLKRLVQIYRVQKVKNIDEHIYSIACALASFASSAIVVGNAEGASLAATRINEAYEVIKRAGLDKEASDVIQLFVRIGILAAGNNQNLTEVDFMSKPLHEWAADILISSGVDLENEVRESYLHTHEVRNHEASLEFITKLGVRMGTNFGFAFDPITGKRYPDNDPRRR